MLVTNYPEPLFWASAAFVNAVGEVKIFTARSLFIFLCKANPNPSIYTVHLSPVGNYRAAQSDSRLEHVKCISIKQSEILSVGAN